MPIFLQQTFLDDDRFIFCLINFNEISTIKQIGSKIFVAMSNKEYLELKLETEKGATLYLAKLIEAYKKASVSKQASIIDGDKIMKTVSKTINK